MSGRAPRFEVVRSDAGWFARFRAANGQKVWQTEIYTRRNAAVLAVHLIAKPLISTPWEHGVMVERQGAVEVREIDERTPPRAPVALDPPYYLTTTIAGEPYWHDSERHYRNCLGGECIERTPPAGTEVHGRFGSAVTR